VTTGIYVLQDKNTVTFSFHLTGLFLRIILAQIKAECMGLARVGFYWRMDTVSCHPTNNVKTLNGFKRT